MCAAGGDCASLVKVLSGPLRCTDFLDGIAIAVADSLDLYGLLLAVDVHAREVLCVVGDDLCKTDSTVLVENDFVDAGSGFSRNRNKAESLELGIFCVVRPCLDIGKLTVKEHGFV